DWKVGLVDESNFYCLSFSAAQREVIVANANLNWIAKGSGLHDAHRRTGHEAHFHQAEAVRSIRLNRSDASGYISGNRIEGHNQVSYSTSFSSILKFTFNISRPC